ncbi:MAG: Cna B-type domain-containing protein [Clostridiales Family XIII bacterium]|jgi:hypothetical protein|nr:Cna B-type domain-containing protein [Clostridiales Family XIII bacterium]
MTAMKATTAMRAKKGLAVLLSLCLAVAMVPGLAFAADGLNSDVQIEYVGGTEYYKDGASVRKDAEVEVSKTVRGTDTENEFIIDLKVRTKEVVESSETIVSPDAAVVLVVDTSQSMQDSKIGSETRLAVAKRAAVQFVNDYAASAAGAARYLAVVSFDERANTKYSWHDLATSGTSGAITAINGLTTIPYTNMQSGLLLARNLLKDKASNYLNGLPGNNGGNATDDNRINSRYVVLLSDGAPWGYLASGNYGMAINDTETVPSGPQEYAAWGQYKYWFNADGFFIGGPDSASEAKYAANAIKTGTGTYGSGYPNTAVIHTIAFGSSSDKTWLTNNIASSSDTSYGASDAANLGLVFTKIVENIQKAAQAWTVTDPMGDYIDYRGPAEGYEANGCVPDGATDTLIWDLKGLDGDKETVSGVTWYTYTHSYRISLDNIAAAKAGVDLSDVEENIFNTNGRTTLNYVIVRDGKVTGSPYVVDFAIPQVKSLYSGLEFTKTDYYTGDAIVGAQFKLSGGLYSATETSGANGVVKFANIPSGHDYTLDETYAPSPYDKDSSDGYSLKVHWAGETYADVDFLYNGESVEKTSGKYLVANKIPAGEQTIEIKKRWLDGKGDEGGRPDAWITLQGTVDEGDPAAEVVKVTKKVTKTEKIDGTNREETISFKVPERDVDSGKTLSYSFFESDEDGKDATPAGYVKTEDQASKTVTNTCSGNTGSVTVNKEWVDAGAAYTDSIEVSLYKVSQGQTAGTLVGEATLSAPGWSHTFTGLDEYDDSGLPYSWYAKEIAVDGYAKAVGATVGDGDTITLRNVMEIVNAPISGTKTWLDNNNAYGTRPDSITVGLYDDNDDLLEKATVSADEGWAYTFKGAGSGYPAYRAIKDGDLVVDFEAIDYYVRELDTNESLYDEGEDEYVVSYDGYNITNTLVGETSLTVTKAWDDGGDSTRPAEITVQLYADNEPVAGETDVISGSDTASFTDLAKYNAIGALIIYSALDSVEGYEAKYVADEADSTKGTLTNTLTEVDSITVTKLWQDSGDSSQRPGSLALTLLGSDGNSYDGTIAAPEAGGDAWTYTFKNLPQFVVEYIDTFDGEGNVVGSEEVRTDVTYTIYEDAAPSGYIATVGSSGADGATGLDENEYAAYTLVNTRAGKVDIDVAKTWIGPSVEKESRDGFSFVLQEWDGESWVDVSSVNVPVANGKAIFKDQPRFDAAGALIAYRVVETLPEATHYVSSGGEAIEASATGDYSTVFTNTLGYVTTSFTFAKVWNALVSQDSVSVQLYQDGTAYGDVAEVTLAENSTYTFDNLLKYGEGYAEHEYSVKEVGSDGVTVLKDGDTTVIGEVEYTVSYDGGNTVINTQKMETTSLTIVKEWLQPEGTEHPAAEFTIKQNGAFYDKIEFVEGTSLEQRVTIDGLPLYDDNFANKDPYEYTVEESGVEGYSLSDSSELEGPNYLFVNIIDPSEEDNTVTVSGRKAWEFGDGSESAAPDQVIVGLYRGLEDEPIATQAAVKSDYAYSFTVDGGKYSKTTGQYIEYSVKELAEDGEGGYAALAAGATASFGKNLFTVSYGDIVRDASGDVSADITNTLLDGYYYKVISRYRTITDGVPGAYTDVVRYELEQGYKDEAVNLGHVVGDADVDSTVEGWKTWESNAYSLVGIDSILEVTLSEPGKDNIPAIVYSFERSVTTGGGGGGGGGGTTTTTTTDTGGGTTATLPDDETPLTDISEPESPLAALEIPGDGEELFILDEETPLADLPQTGATLPGAGGQAGGQAAGGQAQAILADPFRMKDGDAEDEE